ncbi:hypothetical protein [Bacteroides intestinalis]|jgi:hypothetical protein|nr:hypothetical protein [Bacteroides intestinalis]
MDDWIKNLLLFITIMGALALAQLAAFLIIPGILVVGVVFLFSKKK